MASSTSSAPTAAGCGESRTAATAPAAPHGRPTAGRQPFRLADTPAWAPSGRRLAISRGGRIWTVAPDGSGLRQLTRGRMGVYDWDPNWQPR